MMPANEADRPQMERIVPSDALESLLGAFDLLADDEQRVAAAEIVRRVSQRESPPLDDETIDRIADESFLEYDRREAADAEG
jgi:hypothetical protein